MDLDEIKEIIEIDGGKFIICDNGKPTMVVLSFEDYKSKLKIKKIAGPGNIARPLPKELREDELKLDDLPL